MNGPVQAAFSKLGFRGQFACWIGLCRFRRIVFPAGVGIVDVVDVRGARQNEARLGCVSPGGRDEIARALQVALPDEIRILRAENRGQMNDGRDSPNRLDERRGIQQVPSKAIPCTHQSASFTRKTREEARAHEARGACY